MREVCLMFLYQWHTIGVRITETAANKIGDESWQRSQIELKKQLENKQWIQEWKNEAIKIATVRMANIKRQGTTKAGEDAEKGETPTLLVGM